MLRALTLLTTAALAVGACGSSTDAPETPATGRADAGAFPVTVEHKFGSTTIESEPKRVVTVGYTDQDAVLAVGVVPVGVGDFIGGYDEDERPWAQQALKGADPAVVSGQQIKFEAVAAQRPDVIVAITAGLKRGDYEKLSKIAPTVAQSGDYIDFGMPWEEQTLLVGKALGREQRAQEMVDKVKAKFAAARSEHPEFAGKSGIFAYGGPDGYGAYASQDTRSRFLTDLGFRVPKAIDDLADGSFYTDFSQEQFRLMDQDFVLMYGSEQDVASSPVYRRLDVVKDGRVKYIDVDGEFAAALGFSSALSFDYLLDKELPAITRTVEGA